MTVTGAASQTLQYLIMGYAVIGAVVIIYLIVLLLKTIKIRRTLYELEKEFEWKRS